MCVRVGTRYSLNINGHNAYTNWNGMCFVLTLLVVQWANNTAPECLSQSFFFVNQFGQHCLDHFVSRLYLLITLRVICDGGNVTKKKWFTKWEIVSLMKCTP